MSFYITLPSNASMDLFPGNVVSNYTTKLIDKIRLDGTWGVALCKVIFRNSIVSDIGRITISHQKEFFNFDLKIEESQNFNQFFHNIIKSNKGIEALVDLKETDDDFTITPHATFEMRLFGALPHILNIEPDLVYSSTSPLKVEKSEKTIQKNDTIFIYTNIIEEQYIGDTKAQLLETVSIHGQKNETITVDIVNPNYVNLALSELNTINIVLKNSEGENIRFTNLSKVIVKLHFKPKNYE